jgi:hypothetical protein
MRRNPSKKEKSLKPFEEAEDLQYCINAAEGVLLQA